MIVGVNEEPEVIREEKIAYPAEARVAGASGTVRLRIVVDEMGEVMAVKVLGGPGHGLDEAAADAISRFKFRPGIRAGAAVVTTMIYNYTFILE